MPRSVGLLIDSPSTIDALVHQIAAATKATVSATADPAVWQLQLGSVDARLTANHPRIAGEALARRYRYALAAPIADGTSQASSVEVRTLRDAGRTLREVTSLAALLVVDGQNRLAGPPAPDEGEAPEPEPEDLPPPDEPVA